MGFPNVDKFLVQKLVARFQAIKAEPAFIINDLFEDMTPPERSEIVTYLTGKKFTADLRDRSGSTVFIMPHFPLLDLPFPQIGISLGNERTNEKFLDDVVGDAVRYPEIGTQTHWDVPKGYWAAANYQIDVAAATKDESIWLSRLIQRIICEEQDALDAIGVKEINLSLQDLRNSPDQTPMTVFNRMVAMECKVANTWTKRIPIIEFKQGNNTALT